jgi:hypothetical protein
MYLQKWTTKNLLLSALILGTVSTASGQVALEVYEADEATPFDCNDQIMVGTKLTLVVSSDSNDFWNGGLFIAGEDRDLGTLAGRDLDPNTRDWTGSHYSDAGDFAKVTQWKDSSIWGFDLFTFYPVDGNSEANSTVAGNWFVIDYYADDVGECNVGFYDYDLSWYEPNFYITFTHVPTRDLDSDGVVRFNDFAIFALEWYSTGCSDPNWCTGADLDRQGDVNYVDLGLLVEYWLWGAQDEQPNDPYPEDPNIIYSIVDVNGSNDITIDVNDSITLYVVMETTQANNVSAFEIEVDISDTNFGSIDNTEHPNGTAEILAEPNRDTSLDYWGPGLTQDEGIRFMATTTGCAIADGNLTSFVFTCQGQGDLTLDLINWASYNTDNTHVFPKLESIVVHRVDPYTQQAMSQQSQSEEVLNSDEALQWLEDLWRQEKEIRDAYGKKEWDEFINSVGSSYP